MSAKDISKEFDMSFPAISQHLKVLRESGLVLMEKSAQKRIYQVNPEKMTELENWAKQIYAIWANRYDRLERLIEQEKKKIT
jgi:DNA-binding transcriptional ArsR family regulator